MLMSNTDVWMGLALALSSVACLLPSAAAQQPIEATSARIEAQMLDAVEARDFSRAHELGLRLIEAAPNAAMPTYKLACAFARGGETDRAAEWLKISAKCGFRYEAKTLRDEDLDSIRSHPGFSEAFAHIRRNAAAALEEFKVRAAAEAKVLTQLPDPYDPSRPGPLVVALHGHGGNAQGMIRVWKNVASAFGAVLIAPEALDKAGGGFSWVVSYETEHLVLRAVEEARKSHNIDSRRIVLTGFSQGGMATFDIALAHPELFAGAIPVSGFYDHRVASIPATLPGKLPRFAILNGEQDHEVENNRNAARRLEAIRAPVLLNIYKGVGHAFPPRIDQDLGEALRFVLE